jgi:molecular chaperone DnaJ
LKNPYEVLGISPSSTNEEVRDAYRTLAKKYHPDNYVDSPLADMAEEKMKEINSAYDEILRIRANEKKSNSQGSNYGNSDTGSANYGAYGSPYSNVISDNSG